MVQMIAVLAALANSGCSGKLEATFVLAHAERLQSHTFAADALVDHAQIARVFLALQLACGNFDKDANVKVDAYGEQRLDATAVTSCV